MRKLLVVLMTLLALGLLTGAALAENDGMLPPVRTSSASTSSY